MLLLPLPQKPPTLEMQYFLDFRADYLTVIELVSNNDLEQSELDCQRAASNLLPSALQHTSKALAGCISVTTDTISGNLF